MSDHDIMLGRLGAFAVPANIRLTIPRICGLLACLSALVLGCSSRSTAIFKCSGELGTSNGEESIPFESRNITGNSTAIQGSLIVRDGDLSLESFDGLVDGRYEICSDGEATLGFSPAGHSDPQCTLSATQIGDYGIFNKVTGQLRYHVGNTLVILKCRKAEKLVQ